MLQRQLIEQKVQMTIKGFTLIEVLMVMAIFSTGILAVAAMQITSTKGNASARRMTEATALAEKQIENLMQLPYDHADLDPTNNPHVSTQGPYSVNWNVTEIDLDSNGTNDSKKVKVAVNWRYAGKRNLSMQYIIPEY
jgi:prepilin-type N-terminal cleavage/methylation domain-containing protein